MAKPQELTERQRYWLEHLHRAKVSGEALTKYAQSQGLSPGALQQAKSRLEQRGILRRSPEAAQRVNGNGFVPVSIEPVVVGGVAACRLSHVRGWELQCETLPPAQWLRELVEADGDAAA
jgi:hypothetical protein